MSLLTGLSLEAAFDSAFTTVVVLGALATLTFDGLGSAVVSGSVLGTSASTTLSVTAAATATFTVTASAVGTATTTFGRGAVTAFATFAGATAATAGSAGPVATAATTASTSATLNFIVGTISGVYIETTFLKLGGTEDGLLGLELDLLLFAVATALLLLLLGDGCDNLGSALLDLGLEYSEFVGESHCYTIARISIIG